MRNAMRYGSWTLGAWLLAGVVDGCAATGPLYRPAPPPEEGYALVYFYRPFSGGINKPEEAGTRTILINGSEVCELAGQGYTWLHVKAGDAKIELRDERLGVRAITDSISLNLAAGNTYYLRIMTVRTDTSVIPLVFPGGASAMITSESESVIQNVDSHTAMLDLPELRFVEPKVSRIP